MRLAGWFGDAGEDIGEPTLGVDAVEFAGFDQRKDRGGALTAAVRGQVIMLDVWHSR